MYLHNIFHRKRECIWTFLSKCWNCQVTMEMIRIIEPSNIEFRLDLDRISSFVDLLLSLSSFSFRFDYFKLVQSKIFENLLVFSFICIKFKKHTFLIRQSFFIYFETGWKRKLLWSIVASQEISDCAILHQVIQVARAVQQNAERNWPTFFPARIRD